MENGIGSIASKIDAVLKKLDAMDSGKAMRRAAMNKMLNSITADDNGERERERDTFKINARARLQYCHSS